jgi:hypothetical protein
MHDSSTDSTFYNLQILPDNPSKTPLSAPQKTFNRLSRQSARLQQEIQDWDYTLTKIQQRALQELLPVQEQLQTLQAQGLLQLADSYQSVPLGKVARGTLATVLWEGAMALLHEGPSLDPELQAALEQICAEYGPKTVPSEDPGGGDADGYAPREGESFTDFMTRLAHDFLASQGEAPQTEQVKRVAEETVSGDHGSAAAGQGAATARQRAREAQQAAEAQRIRQSLQSLYRQLVRVIHPDRESDATVRAHKTVLMQRANQAYAQKYLLQLLALQQELGQMDGPTMGSWGEDTLRTYNQVLKTHITGLKTTIGEKQARAAACMGMTPFWAGSHRAFVRDFEATLRDMHRAVKKVQHEMKTLQSPPALKAWLTERRREIRWLEQMEQDTAWGNEWPPAF